MKNECTIYTFTEARDVKTQQPAKEESLSFQSLVHKRVHEFESIWGPRVVRPFVMALRNEERKMRSTWGPRPTTHTWLHKKGESMYIYEAPSLHGLHHHMLNYESIKSGGVSVDIRWRIPEHHIEINLVDYAGFSWGKMPLTELVKHEVIQALIPDDGLRSAYFDIVQHIYRYTSISDPRMAAIWPGDDIGDNTLRPWGSSLFPGEFAYPISQRTKGHSLATQTIT